MPEGDTIFRTAATLHRVMAGKVVTRFESVFPALTRVDDDHPIAGRTIESVTARGKHLLITFSSDLVPSDSTENFELRRPPGSSYATDWLQKSLAT